MGFEVNKDASPAKVDTGQTSTGSVEYMAVSDHLCCELNGEAVILSIGTGKYYGVNSVGSFIWSLVQQPISFTDIEAALMKEFEVGEEVCRKETTAFLERMKSEGLLSVSHAASK